MTKNILFCALCGKSRSKLWLVWIVSCNALHCIALQCIGLFCCTKAVFVTTPGPPGRHPSVPMNYNEGRSPNHGLDSFGRWGCLWFALQHKLPSIICKKVFRILDFVLFNFDFRFCIFQWQKIDNKLFSQKLVSSRNRNRNLSKKCSCSDIIRGYSDEVQWPKALGFGLVFTNIWNYWN